MNESPSQAIRAFVYCRKSQESDERQVLSIEGQRAETAQRWPVGPSLVIVGQYEEAKTARKPGRPVFNEMLRRVEAGEANAIIAWDPDRLSRNSVDSGQIIYLIDQGLLKDLKFVTYTFENTPHGKWMLSMLLANAKLHTDKMSEGLSRTYKRKVAKGVYPCVPPLGYQTDRAAGAIVADPVRFPLVRRTFDLLLSGGYSPRQVLDRATNEWGLRTRVWAHSGGKPLCRAQFYALLANPFYTGLFWWKGTLVPGTHPAMITLTEHDRIQEVLGRPGRPRPKERVFAYTGLLRCGACGLGVTAEVKRNHYGSLYTYYHCTHYRRDSICRQPVISVKRLEEQIQTFLGEITIPQKYADWALAENRRTRDVAVKANALQRVSAEQALGVNRRKATNLRGLRIAEQITEEDFLQDKATLDLEYQRLAQALDAMRSEARTIEPEETVISFSAEAASAFARLGPHEKRTLLGIVGSNLKLKDKELSIDAAPPFRRWNRNGGFPVECPWLDDVRTFVRDPANKERITTMRDLLLRFQSRKAA